MRKLINWSAAAALAIGGVALVPSVRADDTLGQKIDKTVEKTKENANATKSGWEVGRVYTMLGQLTNDALTKGDLKKVAGKFNDADEKRIDAWIKDKNNKDNLDKLDGRIAQFQGDWKNKYKSDFKITKDEVVFGNNAMFAIEQGEIGKDAQLAGEKLPPADTTANTVTGGDKNLEKGRNIAYLTVAASHGLPELKVPLIHAMPDSWKIDVPDSVDGKKLYDNLLTRLTAINDKKDKWPDDVNDAYRMVTHQILMAVLDVDNNASSAVGEFGGNSVKVKSDGK